MDENWTIFSISFTAILTFKPEIWRAVEISVKHIFILEKFGISSFTEKKNQSFWTRIDEFQTLQVPFTYPDVTWSRSLKSHNVAIYVT